MTPLTGLARRPAADDGVSAYLIDGTDRDVIAEAVLARLGCPVSAWHHARLARLWRLFGTEEGCAARPSPEEWR